MNRSARVLLEDILESIARIEEYVDGVTQGQFEKDTEKQDAVIRRLEIIGQAVKGLPQDLRDGHPEVPWRQIACTVTECPMWRTARCTPSSSRSRSPKPLFALRIPSCFQGRTHAG